MPSEIDDIFSSKGQYKSIQLTSSSSDLPSKKKKKTKKTKPLVDDERKPTKTTTNKRPAPETIIDSSTSIPSTKRSKVGSTGTQWRNTNSTRKGLKKVDEQWFKDSRGSGPRRKTDEGFSIYKEYELGIGDEGGDTPLCPFDCQCCF